MSEPICKDMAGADIFEGDIVLVFSQNFERTLISDDGIVGMAVYEVNQDKPLPVADVPLYKSKVLWDGESLEYRLHHLWAHPDSSGLPVPASSKMGGGHFVFQKVDE